MLTGVVREWHREDGWGVVDSDATPGGCWAHFSAIEAMDYRELGEGDSVSFTVEKASQDGYAFRAVQVWPAGAGEGTVTRHATGLSGAYRSALTVRIDDDTQPGGSDQT